MKARRERYQMAQRQAPVLSPPDAALEPLQKAVKALRAALVVLEPWLAEQQPSFSANAWRRQIRQWEAKAVELEQIVIGKAEA